jgi:splicing factor 45
MAKYGFRDGQGLGKQEQGMSIALQVEKTSKRGGRIIHEKELLMPPPLGGSMSPPPSAPAAATVAAAATDKPEPTITEIMKSPSKVVLLRVTIKIFLNFFHTLNYILLFSEYGRPRHCG